jgi:hypothetical protein
MAGLFFIDGIRRWIRRRDREKRLSLAAQWPVTEAEINQWKVLDAEEDAATMGAPYQVEAGFHFKLNGEYYGGYLRSVAMGLHESESKAIGSPRVRVRYNPANPDVVAVLAEDNESTLPFRVFSS